MPNNNITFYDILDISPDASPQEVREAYIRTKSTYNRDNVALYTLISPEEREETLKQLEEAYQVLSDPQKRRDYDQNFGLLASSDNPFLGKEEQTDLPSNVISIDRVPPMEAIADGESFLVPPSTDIPTSDIPVPQSKPIETTQSLPLSSGPRSESISIKILSNTPTPPLHQAFRPRQERRSPFAALDSNLSHAIEIETEWRGSFLRKVRDAYQISLEEMATITKVTKHYILAIEEENYSKLPAAVYIRGFVLQIAKVLKLPHEKVATQYLSRYHHSKPE
jgi:curved DNA-binding protein CbpA